MIFRYNVKDAKHFYIKKKCSDHIILLKKKAKVINYINN